MSNATLNTAKKKIRPLESITQSQLELVQALEQRKGAFPMTVLTLLNKENGITCLAYLGLMVGADYKKTKEKSGETNVVVGKLPWGQLLVPNKVIVHKGKLYLRGHYTSFERKGNYFLNGKAVTYEEIKHLLPAKKPIVKKFNENGKEIKPVKIRVFTMDNIISCRYNRKVSTLKRLSPEEQAIIDKLEQKLVEEAALKSPKVIKPKAAKVKTIKTT